MNVTVLDGYTNNPITRDNLNILSNYTNLYILEKIFALTPDIEYYNHFTRIERETPELFKVYNIITDMKNENTMVLYTLSDADLERRYQEYKILYSELLFEDFIFSFKIHLVYIDLNIKQDVESFQDNIRSNRESLKQTFINDETILSGFFKSTRENKVQIKKLIHMDIHANNTTNTDTYTYTAVYNSLLLNFSNNDKIPGVKGIFVNIQKIFNTLQLSNDIPLIGMINTEKVALVKIFDGIKKVIKSKELKSWVLNDKSELSIKKYGLMMKLFLELPNESMYSTVYIMHNGDINIKLSMKYPYSLDTIKSKIRTRLSALVDSFDSNIYSDNRRIRMNQFSPESITASITIDQELSRKILSRLLKTRGINKMFSIKSNVSDTILAFTEAPNHNIINVKENPYKQNSSILTIFNKSNINSLLDTAYIILSIYLMKANETTTALDSERVLKGELHIKELRKHGVEIHSKKCQKDKQPQINLNIQALEDSYLLNYNGNEYRCPTEQYKYPGFTRENMVCCFKKNQKNKEVFIKNTNPTSLDIITRPSNYLIGITEDGHKFATFAINNLSTNELSYISPYSGELKPITSEKVIAQINEYEKGARKTDETIWLKKVPFSSLLVTPSKSKCNHAPDNTITFITDRCDPKFKFNYNNLGIPCCFKDTRKVLVKYSNVDKIEVTRHIIKSNKILDNDRLGELPDIISTTFNKILQTECMYYRIGVVQGGNAFLNCIVTGSQSIIKSNIELKKLMISHMVKNPFQYASELIDFVKDPYSNYNWNILNKYIIHLLETILDINIIIIDNTNEIPRLSCTNSKYKMTNRFIIIIKYNEVYELIVSDCDKEVRYNYSSFNIIVSFLLKYTEKSCLKINIFPENYTFDSLLNWNELPDNIIHSQILDEFYMVTMVMTNDNVLIPIQETIVIQDIEIIHYKQLLKWENLKTANELKEAYSRMNLDLSIRGVTVKNGLITSVLTNTGMLIPVKPSEYKSEFTKLPYNYYSDISGASTSETSPAIIYSKRTRALKDSIEIVKSDLARIFTYNKFDKRENIIEIITKPRVSRMDKFHRIYKILSDLNKNESRMNSVLFNFILGSIVNEMLNDPVKNNLLNGIVQMSFYNQDEIIDREYETVIHNSEEFVKWVSE